jgi:hypothetical protein
MGTVRQRSAGVTAAATYALLCCATALLFWGWIFLKIVDMRDDQGRGYYDILPGMFLAVALVPPAIVAVGMRTAIGVLQLRPWARVVSLAWAGVCIALCLAIIAFRPFETFVIPQHFVKQAILVRQMIAFSFVALLLPVSIWWLFYFRTKSVKLQFQQSELDEKTTATQSAEKA